LGHSKRANGKYKEIKMREVCLVPTFHREELLYCCLKRIRALEPDIHIQVFPDRGTIMNPLVRKIIDQFSAKADFIPDNNWYGNSSNSMDSFLWAYNAGFERIFYIEADVMVHEDFFLWHREMQNEFDDIFASLGWIFNRHAPIDNGIMFQPWIYAIGLCFSRKKLELLIPHATPKYYEDLPGYIQKKFIKSALNVPFDIAHFEFDGLMQRVLDEDKSQTVSPGIAKCSHIGFVRSYGDGGAPAGYEYFFRGCKTFEERINRLEQFMADPYWRMSYFGRAIVEREFGHALPVRMFNYRIKLPDGWESEFTSEMSREHLPSRINSVPVPADAQFVLLS
jgi:hypothetical protein